MLSEEDRRWKDHIEERLASLTAGETVQDGRIEDLEVQIEEQWQTLHGQAGHKEDGGIEGDVRDLGRGVNELRAVMMPDAVGNGGVISRLKRLENKEAREEQSLESRLKFWSPILVAIITSMFLLIREWPAITERWNHNLQELSETKKPVKRIRHKRVRKVVEEVPDAEENVQE